MKKAALISALSAQVAQITIAEDLNKLDGKTSSAEKMLAKMLPGVKHILVIVDKVEPMLSRSLHNLSNVFLITADRVTTYDIAYADGIMMTKSAVKVIEDRLTKKVVLEADADEEMEIKAEEPKVKKAVVKKPAAKSVKKIAEVKPKVKAKDSK